jgi:hypothetical protein
MSVMKAGQTSTPANHCIKQQSAGVRFVKVVVGYRLEPAAGSLVAQHFSIQHFPERNTVILQKRWIGQDSNL